MKNLKPVYVMVHKNELIVREGDRITPQQMDTIEAYYQARSGSAVMRMSLFLGIFLRSRSSPSSFTAFQRVS